jgi:hypothetical protein
MPDRCIDADIETEQAQLEAHPAAIGIPDKAHRV